MDMSGIESFHERASALGEEQVSIKYALQGLHTFANKNNFFHRKKYL